ncbi:hypothetical protein Taro_023098 [Colocasia esculenta]|uniref:Secreted protein n=1 Tax=Colocasia esculenta TaxID=4460 RepID=A0A843VDF5_COLES|nr:hypothetical protein [Colocasia esculenta]
MAVTIVYFVACLTLTRGEVWTWVEDKPSVDVPDRLTSGSGALPVCVASHVMVTTCRFYRGSNRGVLHTVRHLSSGRAHAGRKRRGGSHGPHS